MLKKIITFLGVFVVFVLFMVQLDGLRTESKASSLKVRQLNEKVNRAKEENQTLRAQLQKTRERIDQLVSEAQVNQRRIDKMQFELEHRTMKQLTVTAYTPTRRECNDDPEHTAAMLKPKPGMVAVSRDLFKEGWVFGRKIYVEGLGIFTIADLMNERWNRRMDILMFDRSEAIQFGIQQRSVTLLDL